MDALQTLALAIGSSWLSGLNLYATVGTLGLLGKYGGVQLPGELSLLTNPYVMGVAIAMYVIEFFADKIPYLDSAWDLIHTFIRIPAGALLAYGAVAEVKPEWKAIAFLVGGTLALTSHGTKAATRVAANMSPEPVSNSVLSIGEDAIAIGGSFVAVHYAIPILIFVALMVALSLVFARKIVRLLKSQFKKDSLSAPG